MWRCLDCSAALGRRRKECSLCIHNLPSVRRCVFDPKWSQANACGAVTAWVPDPTGMRVCNPFGLMHTQQPISPVTTAVEHEDVRTAGGQPVLLFAPKSVADARAIRPVQIENHSKLVSYLLLSYYYVYATTQGTGERRLSFTLYNTSRTPRLLHSNACIYQYKLRRPIEKLRQAIPLSLDVCASSSTAMLSKRWWPDRCQPPRRLPGPISSDSGAPS